MYAPQSCIYEITQESCQYLVREYAYTKIAGEFYNSIFYIANKRRTIRIIHKKHLNTLALQSFEFEFEFKRIR